MSNTTRNDARELKIDELEAAVGGAHMSIKFAPEYTKWASKAGSSSNR